MPRRLIVFAVFAAAYFLSYFYRSANAVIAEELALELGLSPAQLGLMTSFFFAAFAAAQLPLGAALDRFGSRWITPLLMLSAVLGSVLFASAQSFAGLALGRALIGLGMAGVLMGALKALSGWFSARRFATVSGVFLGLGASGALGAATPLAWLSGLYGWRAVFWGAAGVTLLSAAAILLLSRDAPRAARAAQAPEGGLSDIFRSPTFWRLALLGFSVTGSMLAYQGLWAGPYVQDVFGFGRVRAGNLLLLLSGGVVLGYLGMGWLGDRFGVARVASLSALGFGAVQLALARPVWPPALLWPLVFSFGVLGGSSLLYFAHARAAFPAHMTGRAVTAVNVFGIGGGAALQWGLGVVLGLFPEDAGVRPTAAYGAAFTLTGLLCLGAAALYWPLRR